VVDALGGLLMADDQSMMVRFSGGKIVHRLQDVGTFEAPSEKLYQFELLDDVLAALTGIAGKEPVGQLAEALKGLVSKLDWYKGKIGPFASINFQQGHAHAILIGPTGLEERSDVRLGLTVLAPYTRFPDHEQTHPRVIIPMGRGEFQTATDSWETVEAASGIFYASGQTFAMRAASRPLLFAWCQSLSK